MPIPLIMPKVDMDQEKATIISWNKSEGDAVRQEETLLVVETEKVAIDVPSPANGVLAGLKFKPGDVVPVATVIAYILKPGETLADLPGGAPTPPPAQQVAPVDTALTMRLTPPKPASPLAMRVAQELGVDIHQVPSASNRISREDVEAFAAALRQQAQNAAPASPAGKIAATPAARRIAGELGVPLAGFSGSGPFGRIQAGDVKAPVSAPQPVSAPASVAAPAQLPTTAPTSSERAAEIIPLAGMRLKIAQRLQASFQEAPHIAETVEADVTRLEELRKRLNTLAAQNNAEKVTLTAVLVRLIAWALERNPYINASLIEENIYLWKDVNIGVATALDSGLIVPVVHAANRLSFGQIAARITELTTRARQNKLELSDVQRGTFTISNLGMYGIRQFRAVINPPESAILAIGSVVRKPVVMDENDAIAVRPIINFTISADHRVIDGVIAAKFLGDLVRVVENPELIVY